MTVVVCSSDFNSEAFKIIRTKISKGQLSIKGVVRRYSIIYTFHKLKHIFVLLRVAKGIRRTGHIPHPSVVQGEFGLNHSNIRTNVFWALRSTSRVKTLYIVHRGNQRESIQLICHWFSWECGLLTRKHILKAKHLFFNEELFLFLARSRTKGKQTGTFYKR